MIIDKHSSKPNQHFSTLWSQTRCPIGTPTRTMKVISIQKPNIVKDADIESQRNTNTALNLESLLASPSLCLDYSFSYLEPESSYANYSRPYLNSSLPHLCSSFQNYPDSSPSNLYQNSPISLQTPINFWQLNTRPTSSIYQKHPMNSFQYSVVPWQNSLNSRQNSRHILKTSMNSMKSKDPKTLPEELKPHQNMTICFGTDPNSFSVMFHSVFNLELIKRSQTSQNTILDLEKLVRHPK